MHKQKSIIVFGILLIAALISFLPLSAQADQVRITSYESSGMGTGMTGQMIGNTLDQPDKSLIFSCLTPNAAIYQGTYYPYSLAQSNEAAKAAWLMQNYAPLLNGGNAYSGYTAAQTSGAVQLAIWQIMGWTVAELNAIAYPHAIYPSSGVQILATTLYGSVPNNLGLGYYFSIAGSQNLVGVFAMGSPVVPIPPTVYLLGAGLLGLVGLRRKFRK